MNLRVDLLLDSERRSASPVSVRNLKRALPWLAPLAVALLGGRIAADWMTLNASLRTAELLWKETEPKKAKVLTLRQQADQSEQVLGAMEAWRCTRPSWRQHLEALQRAVRPQMQLETLRIQHTIQQLAPDRKPARVFTLSLTGRATGPGAEADVQGLTRDLRDGPILSNFVREVEVKFDADPRNKADRIFQIECAYRPLPFHEATRR